MSRASIFLTQLLARQQAGWETQQPVLVEELVQEQPELAERPEVLLDLIYAEIHYRARTDKKPVAAEYLARFPQFEQELAQLFELHEALGGEASFNLETHDSRSQVDAAGETMLHQPNSTTTEGPRAVSTSRYQIVRPHAKGGLGEVYVAKDLELGREVALKQIQARYADYDESRGRFVLEAEITGGLEHPGIVPVYGLGQDANGRPYYAMRFIRGVSLEESITKLHADPEHVYTRSSQPTVELRKLLQRFIDVCNAIGYAHSRGIIHRDLKPGNVMLGNYGETLVVDWGLAKSYSKQAEISATDTTIDSVTATVSLLDVKQSDLTQDGSTLGTPAYMSPEQAAGQTAKLGPASDIYSLGATLYCLLTGQPPHRVRGKEALAELLRRVQAGEFPRPRDMQKRVPKSLEAICLRAMAVDPAQRYASCLALTEDLEHFLADEPVAAKRETLLEHFGRLTRRHRGAFLAGTAGLLLITVGSVVAIYVINEARNQETAALAKETAALDKERHAKTETQAALTREQATVVNLKSEVAHNHYLSGIVDLDQNRFDDGLKKLFLAYCNCPEKNPLKASYLQLLGDRSERLIKRLQHQNTVTGMAFSPDGTRALTGGGEFGKSGEARLWVAQTGEPLGVPMQHKYQVNCVMFSPDGSRVLTGSGEINKAGKARLWDAQTGEPLGKPMQHKDWVSAIMFSPDGKRVLTGSHDKTARLWDAQTGEPLGKPMQHQDRVTDVAFSPDGTRVLTRSWDLIARLWDAQTGEPLGKSMQHKDGVYAVMFSPDATRVLARIGVNIACLWDAQTGEQLGKPMQHKGRFYALVFSPDGTRILTGDLDNSAQLWDAQTGEPLGKPMQHQGVVNAVAFSPDGTRVLTGSGDKTARLWDAQTCEPLGKPMQHQDQVNAVMFSTDGTRVLTGSGNYGQSGEARLWDAQTGEPLGKPMQDNHGVDVVMFSPDGTRVLTRNGTLDKSGEARLWDAQIGTVEPLGKPMQHKYHVKAVLFSSDSTRVLTGSGDSGKKGETRLWDAQTGEPRGKPIQHKRDVRAVAFSPDGTRLLTGSGDKTARLWDAQTGEPLGKPMQHKSGVNAVVFSPDGTRVLTGCRFDDSENVLGQVIMTDERARLWNAHTGEPLGKPLQHQNEVRAVAFSPDGTRVLTGSDDKTARLWDTQRCEPLGKQMQHRFSVESVAFSPDGTRVLTHCSNFGAPGESLLWDALTGVPIGKPMQHQGGIHDSVFSSDGTRVLTGSGDKTARLWDAQTGEPLGKPMQHQDSVYSVAFSPDGTRVLTGSWDKTARFWDAHTGEPLGKPLQHQNSVHAVAFSPDGKRLLTGSVDKTVRLWDASLPPLPQNPVAFWSKKLGVKLTEDKLVPITADESRALNQVLMADTKYQAALKTWTDKQKHHELEFQAAKHEANKNWYAAVVNLTQLTKLEPKNETIAARLLLAKAEWAKHEEARKNEWPALREKLIAEAKAHAKAEAKAYSDTITQLVQSRAAAQPTPWDQAATMKGEVIKSAGLVKQTFLGKQGELIILNFSAKKTGEFCIVIPVKLIPEQEQKNALVYAKKTYVGKTIIVTGLVEFYEPTKTPQITLESLEQLQIEDTPLDK